MGERGLGSEGPGGAVTASMIGNVWIGAGHCSGEIVEDLLHVLVLLETVDQAQDLGGLAFG